MALGWNIDLQDMKIALAEARQAGHTRLFAIAYDRESPVQWHHRPDEKEMQKFLDSRERSESIMFNCAIAILSLNPLDTDETIEALIAAQKKRRDTGPGYFEEAFGY